jgi:hypothetical protein
VLFLKILGGILALAVGIYLGSAGRYRADPEEIEKALSEGGRTRKVKRHFTLFGWLRQNQERSSRVRRRSRGASSRRFDLIAPDPRKKDPKGPRLVE